jgi:hypothetical protein
MLGSRELVDELRREGYDVSHAYLAYLLRERVIPSPVKAPGGAFLWSPVDVAALRRELRRRGRGPAVEDTGCGNAS